MLNNQRVGWLLGHLNEPRNLKTLDALSANGAPMSASEISKATGIHEATVSSECIPDLVKLGLLKHRDPEKTKVQRTQLAVRISAFFASIWPDLKDP